MAQSYLTGIACALFAVTVALPGSVTAGAPAKAAVCAGCHGQDGNSVNPELYPRLSGQSARYLIMATRSYKDGTRKNDQMKVMAEMLSDDEIEDLAAFYAQQPCK